MLYTVVKELNQQIIEIELIASHAWPAHEVQYLGGWMLRASYGITHRANSTLILDELPEGDIDSAIQIIREFYISRGLPPRFQLTNASVPANIDRKIADLGFILEMKVNVQIFSLEFLIQGVSPFRVEIHPAPQQNWLSTYAAVGDYDSFSLGIRKSIMTRVVQKKAYVVAIFKNKVVGVGFGVAERGWLGLFAISTLTQFRRKGIATAITRALAQWGLSKGATRAYLLVEQKNEPANDLYNHLGFKNLYCYWYRLEQGSNEINSK